MFKAVVALIVCVCAFAISNVDAGYDEDVEVINKGMPKLVKQFNKRQIECNHWAGEEPYDKARALEITAAVKKLKCEALEVDEKNLLMKYKSRPDVSKSIKKAKDFI
jgi:hypothetical protein